MDLRYCVSHKNEPEAPLYKWSSVCAVSSESIVAFSRVRSVPSDAGTRILHCVAVADLNCPYHSIDIIECSEAILQLQFSNTGRQLLLVTAAGSIRVYRQVSGALQPDWLLAAEARLEGETVLATAFLHTGLKPQINLGEVKVSSLYNEKFSLLNHTPSLMSPGYCATEGVIAVTASGLVVVLAQWRPGVVEEARTVLGPARGHYTTADISMPQDGSIVISAWQPDVVRCWRLQLSHSVVKAADAASTAATTAATAAAATAATYIDNSDAATSSTHFVKEESQKLLVSMECCESVCPCRPAASAAPSPAGDPKAARSKCPSDAAAMRELRPECYRVSRVFFPYREDPTILLLVLVERPAHDAAAAAAAAEQGDKHKASSGGQPRSYSHIVQKYRLEEKHQPAFKLFKTAESATPSIVAYKVWSLQGEWCSSGVAVTNLGSCPRYLFQSQQLPHIVTVATEDTNITAINLHNMVPVGSYTVSNARHSDNSHTAEGGNSKGRGSSTTYSGHSSCNTGQPSISLAHTWTGLSLLAYDSNATLCFFSLIKPTDIGNLWPLCVLLLLEYCIVSGQDWWELLINTPPSSVVTVVDRLLDTLSLHTPCLHNHHHTRMLLLRHAILRLSSSTQHRATEAMIQANLSAILNMFRQFRPVTGDCNPDKCASNMLTVYLENRSSLDQLDLDKSVDQFLFGVPAAQDCQVEQRSAKYLQPLVQYTAEVALYLLCMMAQDNKNELLREVKTVQQLREVLFRGRVWYRHNKLVAPHITRKTDSVDVWVQLYRLLTRLLIALPAEPDAAFMDEVVLLETQVLCNSLSLSIPSRGFLTTMHHSSLPFSVPPSAAALTPVQYQHGEEDEVTSLGSYQLEGALRPANPRDPLFLHFIPRNSQRLQCSRCWSVRSASHDQLSPWEQQWANRCLCSGHWITEPAGPGSLNLLDLDH